MAIKFEFELVDTAAITSQGTLTIPKPARMASGLGESCRVLVFVERGQGFVLLSHEPLAEELLKAAAKAAQRKRAG